ncbi:MAG: hypothetical protein IIY02_00960, partial [Firmicutes bacterium]|nr:hypothetical protein [Bacillota bacterium]
GSNGLIGTNFQYNKNTTVGFDVPSNDSSVETLEDEKYYRAYTVSTKGSLFSHAERLTAGAKLYDVDCGVIGAALREMKIIKRSLR